MTTTSSLKSTRPAFSLSPVMPASGGVGLVRMDDDAHRPDEPNVVPRPSDEHLHTVLEPDQVVEVHDEPDQPAHEAGEAEGAHLADCRRPADRRERPFVAVAE